MNASAFLILMIKWGSKKRVARPHSVNSKVKKSIAVSIRVRVRVKVLAIVKVKVRIRVRVKLLFRVPSICSCLVL